MVTFCCPICGTSISQEDRRCSACDSPLSEMGYIFNKALYERTRPKIIVDFDAWATEPLEPIICPNCGARTGSFDPECHACGFRLKKKIEEGCGPILRTNAGYAERRSVAIDPRASHATLKALSEDALPFVRRGVAANPSAPQDFLVDQSTSEDASMRAAVAGNPSTPSDILDALSKDGEDSVKRQVALNGSSPGSARSEALATMQRATLEELAKDESPEWLLSALADSDDKWVRNKVAANPLCARAVLERLGHDQEESVRIEVAKNLSTPEKTLVSMAEDVSPIVRYELAKNPRVPTSIRESLSTQQDVLLVAHKAIVRRAEPQSVDPRGVREHLFSPKNENRSIAGSPSTSEEVIRNLVEQEGAPLRECLGNPATPPDIVQEILRKIEDNYVPGKNNQCQYTMARVAMREDLDGETIHLLATSRYEWVLRHIADDPRISDRDLEGLSRHPDPRVRAVAARNPKATDELLERLAFDKEEEVRLSVLWNPRIPRDLISVIDCSKSKQVANVLKARNPDIPAEELERYCPGSSLNWPIVNDELTLVRTEAAQNVATSATLLAALARDSYREVRQAVLRNPNAPDRIVRIAESNQAPTPLKGREKLPKTWATCSELDDFQWLWGQYVVRDERISDIDYDFLYGVRKDCSHSYLETMAGHERAPIFIFERIAFDTDMPARKRLAANRCTPTHLQRKLAFDQSADVRRSLAESEFATPDVLDILSYDVDNRARKEACLRLRKLLL